MKILQGYLLNLAEQGHFDIILHGCNCFNTMGAGIAKQIKQKYPNVALALAKKAKDKHREQFWVDMQQIVAHSCRDMGEHIRQVQEGGYLNE